MKKNKIIIFGGNGVLGSALADKILKEYNNRILIFDKIINKKINRNKKINYLRSDINKISIRKLKNLFKSTSVIYYLIGKPGNPNISSNIDNCWDFISVNSFGFWKVVKVAETMKIKKIIVASSITSISDLKKKGPYKESDMADIPPNFYGLSKALIEDISNYKNLNSNLKILVIRYPRIYYNKSNNFLVKFARQMRQNKPITTYGQNNKLIDFVHLDDAVNFAYKCFKYNGSKNFFHVTYNFFLNLKEIINYISSKINPIKLKLIKKNAKSPRESNQAALKSIYSSKEIKIKYKYNIYKILNEAINFSKY